MPKAKGVVNPDAGGDDTFEEFINELEHDLMNSTSLLDNAYNEDYDKDTVLYPTPKDPYPERQELPKDLEDYWNILVSTPSYDDGYDEDGEDILRRLNLTDMDYSGSVSPLFQNDLNDTYETYTDLDDYFLGYDITHAVYMGTVVLVLLVNVVLLVAMILQAKTRSKASTILILNFFIIEILLSVVDLFFTNILLNPNSQVDQLPNFVCRLGPWMLHITQAAQPVAIFIINMEAVMTAVSPSSGITKTSCRLSIFLVVVTWLAAGALASLFAAHDELFESFVVLKFCTFDTSISVTLHFWPGILELSGCILVLLVSCSILAVVVLCPSKCCLPTEPGFQSRANVVALVGASITYSLVTVPVIAFNLTFMYTMVPVLVQTWITIQLVRRLGSLLYPAFWWGRPDVRHSIKHLPSLLVCPKEHGGPRLSVITTDPEATDLLPLELSEVQPDGVNGNYRAV